jgi:hypothetical protein
MRGTFRPKREDVPGGWEKIMRKFFTRIFHQILKPISMVIEVNFVGVR